jgi:hypothetical protein
LTKFQTYENYLRMNEHRKLSDIFGANVTSIKPLTAGFGIRVVLEKFTNVAAKVRSTPVHRGGEIYTSLSAPDIYRVVQDHGIIVIDNAFVTAPPNLRLSGVFDCATCLPIKQDPFHRDALASGNDFCVILSKPLLNKRHAPTLYALETDVRQAIDQLDIEGLLPNVASAVQEMRDPQYSFTLSSENRAQFRLAGIWPEFTTEIAKRIPPERLYTQNWRAGAEGTSVVMHAVRPDCPILHARPYHPLDFRNTVEGRRIDQF